MEVSCEDAYLRIRTVAAVRDGRAFALDSDSDSDAGLGGGLAPDALGEAEAQLCSALSSLQTESLRDHSCVLECAEIALLNNTHYHQSFGRALDKLLAGLRPDGDGPDGREPLYVLDVSEGFSALPLMAARRGRVRAYSSVEKEQHQAVLRLLAQANGVQQEALEFWLNHVEDDSTVLQRPEAEKLWSVIILDCVETCGLIRQKLLEKATLARSARPSALGAV